MRSPFLVAGGLLAVTLGVVLVLALLYPDALPAAVTPRDAGWTTLLVVVPGASLAAILARGQLATTLRAALFWVALGAALVALYLYLGDAAPEVHQVWRGMWPERF